MALRQLIRPRPRLNPLPIASIAPRQPFSRLTPAMSAPIQKVSTDKAFPVAGPYSAGTIAPSTGQIVHVSGQIPGRPDGSLVEGSIGDKAEQCIANIKAVLEAAGSDLDHVLKVGIFVTNMAVFKEVNVVFEKRFPHKPARSTVGVASLPLGVEIEMECVAVTK